MTTAIRFSAGGLELDGVLDHSSTAAALAERLPVVVRMSRWGDEYYGGIEPGLGLGESDDAREEMRVGELAYWPVGDALCVFFGPTPASSGDEPRAASPVNPVGRLEGDVSALRGLPGSIEATVSRR